MPQVGWALSGSIVFSAGGVHLSVTVPVISAAERTWVSVRMPAAQTREDFSFIMVD